ncbi:MAG: helix-turn-helix domain-containing protein [Sphingomonadaceae bacterium]|jgi:AcrR family transcriptional regulator
MATKAKTAAKDGAAKRTRRAYLPAAERKKQIIAAAQKVFAEKNLQGARTRDLAEAAGVNQATIFEHFESKEALFREAVIQPLSDAMRGMYDRVKAYDAAATPDELADLAFESAKRHTQDMAEVLPLLVSALFSDPEMGREFYRKQIAPLNRQRGTVLDGLTREGIDLEFVGLANFGMLFAIALENHFGTGKTDLTHMARQFGRMSTGGFARDKEKDAIGKRIDDDEAG